MPLGASYSFTLSGLAIAAIVGILLNAILPGNDYEFGTDLKGDTRRELRSISENFSASVPKIKSASAAALCRRRGRFLFVLQHFFFDAFLQNGGVVDVAEDIRPEGG